MRVPYNTFWYLLVVVIIALLAYVYLDAKRPRQWIDHATGAVCYGNQLGWDCWPVWYLQGPVGNPDSEGP